MDKVISPGSRRNSSSNRKDTSIDVCEDNYDSTSDEPGMKYNKTVLSDDKSCKQYVHNSNEDNVSDSPTVGCCGTCLDCTM